MPKTKEELNTLKQELEKLNNKLSELSEDELKEVIGGSLDDIPGPEAIGPDGILCARVVVKKMDEIEKVTLAVDGIKEANAKLVR